MRKLLIILVILPLMILTGCKERNGEDKLREFIAQRSNILQKLEAEVNLADWNAATSGTKESYSKLEEAKNSLIEFLSSREDFEFLREWLGRKSEIEDPLLRRQLEMLYNYYLPDQGDPALLKKINSLETAIARKFSLYRAKIDGKEYSMNDIEEVLKTSSDEELRRKAWEAQKGVGKVIEKPLIELVKLRNKLATSLGFKNYYEMKLRSDEMDPESLFQILDKLAEITNGSFVRLKKKIDQRIARMRGKNPEELMPWDYEDPFFQEAPAVFRVNLDKFYKGKNIPDIALSYYDSVGIDLHDVIKKSDLFERPGKNPHAFEIDINRAGDVRVLLNIKENEYWMSTALHELGHAAYSKYVDHTNFPYLLRREAHMFITEAVAMFFEDMTKNPDWMVAVLNIKPDDIQPYAGALKEFVAAKALIFARWSMVITHFERDLYANPDQNLNELWWKYKRKYQLLRKPEGRDEPDWASKIHIALYPVYYHNYMLGSLLASQFYYYIITNIYGGNKNVSFADEPEIGRFFIEKVFYSGSKYRWDDMIKEATGEPLNVKYFVERFLK